MLLRSIIGGGMCLLLASGNLLSQTGEPQKQDPILKDFEARVNNYLEVRKKEAGSSPRPTNSADKLAQNRSQMAGKVRVVRSDAKRGDIFTPEIATYFRHQISASFSGPNGQKVRSSLNHAEPVDGIALKVNEPYPPGMPLQSLPPTLLSTLPRLPKELQYRIVGNNLALHDTASNLIVDFISNAIPTS
jgi:hypothetical protein